MFTSNAKARYKNFTNYTFFNKQHFYKQRQAEIGKKLIKANQHPETELLPFENYSLSSSKSYRTYSKKCTKKYVRLF